MPQLNARLVWQPAFDDDESVSYKVLQLRSLGVYCDPCDSSGPRVPTIPTGSRANGSLPNRGSVGTNRASADPAGQGGGEGEGVAAAAAGSGGGAGEVVLSDETASLFRTQVPSLGTCQT